ncbi:hypothetical protein [Dysgonomonas sp. 511]|uniref:hypothetical protein n=1 Tax=Dysgonomonas sp. 511 TaxID=2302930 RepID=UPI0013D42992|nr:hypothetical protein [Dysgonomonas sp. 511]NDV80158.1 hypothetical protein [Dysgonomonas sp. 511]
MTILSTSLFAHSDVGYQYKYGNVKGYIFYGYYEHEERNKAEIIAQYAELLAKEMNYRDTIFLNFTHDYVKGAQKEYEYKILLNGEKKGLPIVISQNRNRYDIIQTLLLVEYAINNKAAIEKTPQKMLPDADMEKITSRSISENVSKIISHKIYKPADRINADLDQIDEISYYVQNNKFHVYKKGSTHNAEKDVLEKTEEVLLQLDNIYQFSKLRLYPYYGSSKAVVFDSDSSFYCIDIAADYDFDRTFFSKRYPIDKPSYVFEPYLVNDVGGNIITIHFVVMQTIHSVKHKVIGYRMEDDCLIEDLNHFFNLAGRAKYMQRSE